MIRSIHGPFTACLTLAVSALLAGCAGPPLMPMVDYNTSYDFNSVRTVALHPLLEAPEENPAVLTEEARERITRALRQSVEAKGLQIVEDPQQADMLLSWYLVTEDKTEERRVTTGAMADLLSSPAFVSYYNRAAFYQCWECITPTNRTEVQEYRSGTFIVDLIDPRDQKSMWRSVTTLRLRGPVGKDQSRYDAAATQALQNFPPA